MIGPALAAFSPVGSFLVAANLHTATRRFSSASTPLVLTSAGPGVPPAFLARVRETPGVRSAVALTSTTLGPGLGESS